MAALLRPSRSGDSSLDSSPQPRRRPGHQHSEATPLLNTPAGRKDRYAQLTPLTPTTSPLAKESSRRRRDHHAEWHAQRALEPTLDDLFTPDREPEIVDTIADPSAVGLTPAPHAALPSTTASRASRGGAPPPAAFLGGIPLGGQRVL